ncbi:MAG TPA: SIMPL domain-containing protein [Marmoricola sp.]|jgi:hypothetical protein|nr:SIMPL domain-containing protein [Marmoricola sp.]
MSEPAATPRSTIALITCIGVLVIALAVVFLVGTRTHDDRPVVRTAAASTATSADFGIVTSADASVPAVPNQVSFNASVSSTRSTTAAATAATNAIIRSVIAAAKQSGVEARYIRTTSLSVHPSYDYTSSGQHLVGYTSSERVNILVRPLSLAGETIGAVTTAGGNAVSIGSVTLSMSNQTALLAQARAAAIRNAKAAADAMASAAGRTIGELVYVDDAPQAAPADYPLYNLDLAAVAKGTAPISAGTKSVSVTVQTRWTLR